MARKRKSLDEQAILTKVSEKVQEAISWFDSKLSTERDRVQRYYDSEYPRKQSDGNSSYVSSDVYDSVESMKAQLCETFIGGNDIVRFTPRGEEDVVPARIATRYTDYVVHSLNPSDQIFQSVIHDGLMSRGGIVKAYWSEEYLRDEETFEKLPLQDVEALAAQEDVEELEAEEDEDNYDPQYGPVYSGTLTRKIDRCQVRIDVIPPEEFYVEPRVKRREDGVRGHRTLKTRAELIAMGYPKSKVEKVNWSDAKSTELSQEHQARHDDLNASTDIGNDAIQAELQQVMLFETYIDLALKGDGTSSLYKVVHAGSVLFDIAEVDEDPFVTFTPLPRPHAFWGNNFAARVIPTQNAKTVLTRGVLDHTGVTTNPRWVVVKGALLNPKEMLDNRLGGLVNVTRPDGILPLPQGPLNPFIFEVLKGLSAAKEESTGISSLSQGLDKDAISKQNSQGLVNDLVSLSQIRQKVVARNFAGFVKELYLKVYRLVLEHEKSQRIIEVAGEFVPVDPKSWIQRKDVTLSLHLGYGEQDKYAQKLQMVYAGLAQDPAIAPLFDLPQRYKLATDTMRAQGVHNHPEYLGNPATTEIQPPQPDPIEMGKVEAMKMQAQAALMTAQAAQQKTEVNATLEQMRIEMERMQQQLQSVLDVREADRQDADVYNRIDVSQRELDLAEKQSDENSQAIFSPNAN